MLCYHEFCILAITGIMNTASTSLITSWSVVERSLNEMSLKLCCFFFAVAAQLWINSITYESRIGLSLQLHATLFHVEG